MKNERKAFVLLLLFVVLRLEVCINIFRYWEEASSGRDFVIILTVVVLYQVNLLRPTCNCLSYIQACNYFSSFKLATVFPPSHLQPFFSFKLFFHRPAWFSLPFSTPSIHILGKPRNSASCSTLVASLVQSPHPTYQVKISLNFLSPV